MTITEKVYTYLDGLTQCEISGWELFNAISIRYGNMSYPTTLLRIAKQYADITGAEFKCIDSRNSRYSFRPGFMKIGNMKRIGME